MAGCHVFDGEHIAETNLNLKADDSKKTDCWFIPVPTQVQADLSKFTNENNLMPLLDGKYIAEIVVSISYFMQDKGKLIQKLPKYPKIGEPIQNISKYQSLMLTLPRIPIVVESKHLGQSQLITHLARVAQKREHESEQTSYSVDIADGTDSDLTDVWMHCDRISQR